MPGKDAGENGRKLEKRRDKRVMIFAEVWIDIHML